MTTQPSAPLDLQSAIRAISALSELHATGSTRDEEFAIDAFQSGRPAYWTTAGYSNQVAGLLLETANRVSLQAALERHADDNASLYLRGTPYLLSTLIPLNKEARIQLNAAWCALGDAKNAIRRARAKQPVPMFEDASVPAMAEG